TIVDVGANIGAAAVFLLHLFPESRVIAVEPAPGNFDVLQKNLAPYGDRAAIVPAAVWPTPTKVQLQRGFRDGRDWSIQVRPAEAGTVEGITVNQLLERFHLKGIELLKIDI